MTKIFLASALALSLCGAARAQNVATVSVRPIAISPIHPMVVIDGKAVDVEYAELVRSVEVMVWVRDLQGLGWGTVTSGPGGQVVFQSKNVTLTFGKDDDKALLNSLSVSLPIRTFSRNGKFLVPLAFVAKALGYDYQFELKPVATVTTTPVSKAPPKTITPTVTNTVQGKVVYHGTGIKGIKVRLVDTKFDTVKGAEAVTNALGNYTIEGLPDGTYMAYVYVKDNPHYFNRKSEKAILSGGKTALLDDISLGKILTPVSPRSHVAPTNGKIGFAWTRCEGAAYYELLVKKPGTNAPVAQITAPRPTVQVSASRFVTAVKYVVEVSAFDSKHGYLGGTAKSGGKPWTFSIDRSNHLMP